MAAAGAAASELHLLVLAIVLRWQVSQGAVPQRLCLLPARRCATVLSLHQLHAKSARTSTPATCCGGKPQAPCIKQRLEAFQYQQPPAFTAGRIASAPNLRGSVNTVHVAPAVQARRGMWTTWRAPSCCARTSRTASTCASRPACSTCTTSSRCDGAGGLCPFVLHVSLVQTFSSCGIMLPPRLPWVQHVLDAARKHDNMCLRYRIACARALLGAGACSQMRL